MRPGSSRWIVIKPILILAALASIHLAGGDAKSSISASLKPEFRRLLCHRPSRTSSRWPLQEGSFSRSGRRTLYTGLGERLAPAAISAGLSLPVHARTEADFIHAYAKKGSVVEDGETRRWS